jgi:tetratricopeptide (TPR) repeat protein
MKHVTAIKAYIAKGDTQEAYSALDNLLALGPNNIEALKLQAMLYNAEGRYTEETTVWHKVLTIDNEDIDAITFMLKLQNEDREHYYFTDDLTGGARRYMAYPRTLVTTSMIGLFGCMSFLTLSRLAEKYPELGEAKVMLANFFLMVICPWFAIIWTYLRGMKSITVSKLGIEIATRLKLIKHNWAELSSVSLAHSKDPENPELVLVLVPKNEEQNTICIDMNEDSSSVRARSYLLREIASYARPFSRNNLADLKLVKAKTLRF